MRLAGLAVYRDFRRALGTRRALLRLPAWLVHSELVVLALDLDRAPLPPPADVPLAWSPVGEAEVPLVVALNPALDPAGVRRALAAGEDWWLARLDGEPVHFRAYAAGRVPLPYLGRALRLEAGDVLLGGAYTAAGRRRRGILAAAARWSQGHVRARGHRRMVALVATWNEAPRRVAERTGFAEIGRVARWRLGPWRRWSTAGEVRFDEAGDLRLPISGSGGPSRGR